MSSTNGTLNSVTLIGRLGQDPVIRYTGTGTAVCSFNLATSRWNGKENITDWHRVVIWGKSGETAQEHLKSGRKVLVQGEMRTKMWEADGVRRYTTEVHAISWQFMDAPNNGKNQQQPKEESPTQEEPEVVPVIDDDMPW